MALEMRKSKPTAAKKSSISFSDTSAPQAVKEAVDTLCTTHRELKVITTQHDIAKKTVLDYAQVAYAKRCIETGVVENISVEGVSESCNYICKNFIGFSSIDTEYDDIVNEFGQELADEVLQPDYSTFKLDKKVMEDPVKNKQVQDAIEKVEKELGYKILVAGTWKPKDNAVQKALRFIKDPLKLVWFIGKMKLQNYPDGR